MVSHVDEIELHYFWQTQCVSVFLLGEKKFGEISPREGLAIDHGRSDWLGCFAEFVQMAHFRLLFCLYLTFQNNLT